MSAKEFEIKPIRLSLGDNAGAASPMATDLPLGDSFAPLAAAIHAFSRQPRGQSATDGVATGLVATIDDFLTLAGSLDTQYGPDAELPMADAGDAVDEALRCLAELENSLDPLGVGNQRTALHTTALGVGYWAMRHRVAIGATEPIVNALAERANGAASRREAAATYALMQGFIAHLKPHLGADLERSNPARPWRLLNLNFAITAIRTGDPAMMQFAFTSLNAHLPDESAGFYAEAHALACQPGFPEATRTLIEAAMQANSAGWTRLH